VPSNSTAGSVQQKQGPAVCGRSNILLALPPLLSWLLCLLCLLWLLPWLLWLLWLLLP